MARKKEEEETDWQHKIAFYEEGELLGEGTYGKVHRNVSFLSFLFAPNEPWNVRFNVFLQVGPKRCQGCRRILASKGCRKNYKVKGTGRANIPICFSCHIQCMYITKKLELFSKKLG